MKLSIPEQHQKRIALSTLRMSDSGANIMGGMNKTEARAFLLRIGYTRDQIARLETVSSICGNPIDTIKRSEVL